MKRRASLAAWCVWALILVVLLLPARLLAETSAERLERAKALFREGNALLGAGDPERALDRFLQSREAVASGKNTANAAICLERLGRDDEALEMYEELLARFSKDLDAQDRENLAPIMASLRARLGNLDISSNVEGLIIVDGKPRGMLPRTTALRVRAGERRLRVVKEGYQSFESTLNVEAGQVVAVDASLDPLSGLGALRVEQTGREPAQLLVDGKPVGSLPWEGTLATGPHLVQAVGAADGSKPEGVRIIERKTLLVRLTSQKLGPEVRLDVMPRSALLSLEGVVLAQGFWNGRLPLGRHEFRAEEPGYFTRTIALEVKPDAATTRSMYLERDASHLRWPQPARWFVSVRASGAFTYAPTLNGGTEALCPSRCVGKPSALGGRFEAGAELLRDGVFGMEAMLGYQFAQQAFTRALNAHFKDKNGVTFPTVTYALSQELTMGGVFARFGGVARLKLRWGFALRSAVGFGLAWNRYQASAEGVAWNTGDLAAAEAAYETISELMPFATSGLGLEHAVGPLHLLLGVSAWFVPTLGPSFTKAELKIVPGACDRERPNEAGCAPISQALKGERAHGPFASLGTELTASYRF